MQSFFNTIGLPGAGIILIIVGIVFATSGVSPWAPFCIILGVGALALAGAIVSEGILQLTIGIISIGCFLGSIAILLVSLHL
jgi:hypothetical protein